MRLRNLSQAFGVTQMPIDPKNYISQPHNWFTTDINYEGVGRAEFDSPAGYISGYTKVQVNEVGNAHILMEIEEFDCESYLETNHPQYDTLMWLLNGRKPHNDGSFTVHAMGINPQNTCTSLIVTTQDGIFSADGKLLYNLPMFDSGNIVFHVSSSDYQSKTDQSIKYWVMPLTNLVSKALETIGFPLQRHILDQHPLRVFPTPTVPFDLPPEEQREAIAYSNRANCFIPFKFGEELERIC